MGLFKKKNLIFLKKRILKYSFVFIENWQLLEKLLKFNCFNFNRSIELLKFKTLNDLRKKIEIKKKNKEGERKIVEKREGERPTVLIDLELEGMHFML